jgi:hypothetical protein
MSTKQVAKKKTNGKLAVMQEAMFEEDAGAGVTDLSSEDLAIPFLKILQKMSPELDDIESAKSGDIINTVTKDVIKGKKGVRVVNCAYSLQYIEWEPRGTGTGAPHHIYTSSDTLPATERGDDNKDYLVDGNGRYLERTAQHYVLVLDNDGMTQQALMPMKATQFKKSKQWNSAMRALKMRNAKGTMFIPPRFSHIWHLTTGPEENKNGSWHGWIISKESQIKDPDLYQEAKTFAEMISAGAVKIQHVREDNSRDDDVPF